VHGTVWDPLAQGVVAQYMHGKQCRPGMPLHIHLFNVQTTPAGSHIATGRGNIHWNAHLLQPLFHSSQSAAHHITTPLKLTLKPPQQLSSTGRWVCRCCRCWAC
jgi:hypothetical protein